MKNYIYICLVAFSAVFIACDKIEGDPIEDTILNAEFDPQGREYRKILMEDYTGQGCGNCPLAPIEVKKLQETYGKRIVPVAVHAGFFANPQYWPYATLSTPEGEAYDVEFGNSNRGNPNGLVNRIFNANGDSKVFTPSQWSTAIASQLNDLAPLSINVETAFDNDSTFSTVISGEFHTNMPNSYNMVISLVEDSIVAPQHFYAGIDGRTEETVEQEYVHRHVFRGNINGTWGTPFSGGDLKDDYQIAIPKFTIPANWNKKNLSLVVYIYNTNDKEILHVTENHISH